MKGLRHCNEKETLIMTEQDKIRYCPYCGMTSFETSDDEGSSVFCEYCGIDVETKELIP